MPHAHIQPLSLLLSVVTMCVLFVSVTVVLLRECVFPYCAGLLTQQRVVSLCFHGLTGLCVCVRVYVCVCVASLHFICPVVSLSNKPPIARHSKVLKRDR